MKNLMSRLSLIGLLLLSVLWCMGRSEKTLALIGGTLKFIRRPSDLELVIRGEERGRG